jgi:hypothetical protein
MRGISKKWNNLIGVGIVCVFHSKDVFYFQKMPNVIFLGDIPITYPPGIMEEKNLK